MATTHWMVYVKWTTVIGWKRRMVEAREHGGIHPYQYSSNSLRFRQIESGDILWVVTTPKFNKAGRPSSSGRARPPAVMARLRITGLCCNRWREEARIAAGKRPVCSGSKLSYCDEPGVLEEGVHPASDAWSIVAIGEKDPAAPVPLQVTYPALYNIFGVLHRLSFESQAEVKDLTEYLEYVKAGQYLSPAKQKAAQAGRKVSNPGPYGRLGSHYLRQTRKLTAEAAASMDAFHDRAVRGKRLFFSYKWDDVERIAAGAGQTRREWISELNRLLDEAGYSSWLDHHQILQDETSNGLLQEVLADAVHQSVVFVALLTEQYCESWSLKEWMMAREQLTNENRRDSMQTIVLACGGDPKPLGLDSKEKVLSTPAPTPAGVVGAIEQAMGP